MKEMRVLEMRISKAENGYDVFCSGTDVGDPEWSYVAIDPKQLLEVAGISVKRYINTHSGFMKKMCR